MTFGYQILIFLGGNVGLTRQILSDFFKRPFYFDLILQQVYSVGVRSFPLIAIVAGSVGMVMALQFGIGLEKFGGKLYIPKLVSVSVIREMGPVFSSLMFAARVGAGITSEVGSMMVTQQIDAMRALGTSPIKRIVIPRVIACLIALPLLVVLANAIGLFGGLVVGALDLGLDANFYFQKIKTSIGLSDYLTGFGKAVFFALFVSIPSCYFGMNVEQKGTKGVGTATTTAVVVSSIMIIVGDYFLTKVFWIFER